MCEVPTGDGAPQSIPASLLMMLQRDFTLSRTFSVCFLLVGDRSRVTPRYFGAKSCTSTYPASVTFRFLAACVSRSPLTSLRLGAASSSQRTRSGVRYHETVYSQGMFDDYLKHFVFRLDEHFCFITSHACQ